MKSRTRWPKALLLLLPLAGLAGRAEASTVFSEAPPISTNGGQALSALAADVDGDGDQDLVSREYSANLVLWYENLGGSPPVWTKRTIDAFASGPQDVAVGDVEGDGDLDVFSGNFNQEGVTWYENSGANPPTWTKRILSGVDGAWAVHAADLDDDGDVDAIGGNRLDQPPDHVGIEWYENDGASPPSFTVRRVSAGFVDAASVTAADVDGDGDQDVLSVDVFRDSVFWFENSGAHPPAWTQRTVTAAADDPFAVFAADLDRDGDVDVLSASSEDDKIAWYENDGRRPPVFTPHVITLLAPRAIAVFARDLDGDGDPDVLSGARGNEIAWYESDGGSPPSFTRRVISTGCSDPGSAFAARLDPDADVDVLAGCSVSGSVQWYPNNANFLESDGDGVRDGLDCAPADATAFAVPAEVRRLRWSAPTLLAWETQAARSGEGTVHDVIRGSLTQLPVGAGSTETCRAAGTNETTLGEGSIPAAGTGFYYLVRASNTCDEGSYGFTSAGIERTSAACP